MKKSDKDYGLYDKNIDDHKLKKPNYKYFIIIPLILLVGYYFFYLKSNLNFDSAITDLKKEQENEIQENVDIKTYTETKTKDMTHVTTDSSYKIEKKHTNKLILEKTITELDTLSGKYFIISGSFSNYNLSLNKAKLLLDDGYEPVIILPINYNNMYRVAVDLYDNIELAKINLASYKQKLNEKLWILKH